MNAAAEPRDPRLFAPLARFGGARPPAPDWFTRAMDVAPQVLTVPVEGAAIETLAWGEVGRPGLLLMHGNGAHAGWWRFIAPFFAQTHRVAAFSWSGMGGSAWREAYALETFAAEIMAVAEATGLFAGAARNRVDQTRCGRTMCTRPSKPLLPAFGWHRCRLATIFSLSTPSRENRSDA